MEEIYGVVKMDLVGPGYDDEPGDPKTGKPYVVLRFGSGETAVTVRVTANIAEMIGGAGRGMNARIREMLEQPGGES